MNKAFEVFVNKHHLFEKNDKLLLAVSGGIDSMVMFRMVIRSNPAEAPALLVMVKPLYLTFGMEG